MGIHFGDVGELTQDIGDELFEEPGQPSIEEPLDDSIIEVIEILEKKQMINLAVKELSLVSKCNINKNGDTTILMYRIAHNSKENQNFKTNKLIEITHNDESIFVRKIIVVWLFQEDERMSSDRPFHVRA